MENKLSEQQVERAAEAALRIFDKDARMETSTGLVRDMWRKSVRAAAPFLQMPIAEPSEEEVDRAVLDAHTYPDRGLRISPRCGAEYALKQFVARRNAALLPNPDPRLEAIEAVLAKRLGVCQVHRTLNMKALANEVVAALEEVQK